MPIFAVIAPHLSPDQHFELEEWLLDIPGVDAFFNEEGAMGTEVTAPAAALPEVVATVMRWGAAHERGASLIQFACPGGNAWSVADHHPAELSMLLAACGEDASRLRGLTKRLADDGVHEGR